jgi:hypothetical protein
MLLLAGHDHSGVWLALTSCFQSIVLWILSLWYGIGSLFDYLDILCLVLCIGGVTVWLSSGQSLSGLLASIAADFIACIPSLYKTFRLPHTETITFYALDSIAGFCMLFSTSFTLQAAPFPLYIATINGAYVTTIIARRMCQGSVSP